MLASIALVSVELTTTFAAFDPVHTKSAGLAVCRPVASLNVAVSSHLAGHVTESSRTLTDRRLPGASRGTVIALLGRNTSAVPTWPTAVTGTPSLPRAV